MSNHLDSISIKQFRGLRELQLDNLGRVNLFVGANNSGKTSVLEAISVFSRPLDPVEWLNTSRRREVSGSAVPIVRLAPLRWLFPQTADQQSEQFYKGRVEILATGNIPVQSVIADYQELAGVPDEDTLKRSRQLMRSRESDETYLGAELQVDAGIRLGSHVQASFVLWETFSFIAREKESEQSSVPVRTITPVSHRTERNLVERYSRTVLKNEREAVLELIQQFDAAITDIQVLDPGSSGLYLTHKKTGVTPLSALGDGVRRAVAMALTVPQAANGVLLIDEIETAIHVSVLNEVYQWLYEACQRYNVQLFATTHSLDAVDALLKAHPASTEDLVTYRLDLPSKPAKRFGGELLGRLRDELGLDVR
mgnify:CR=1 FL=1